MSIDATGISFPSVVDGKKRCPQCEETKDISEYHFMMRVTRDGRKIPRIKAYCKACCSKQRIAYHFEKHEKNLSDMQSWKDSNRERINEYAKKYAKEYNKIPYVHAANNERTRLRRAKIRLQELSLTESERFQINFLYRVSLALTKITGTKYEVDHIYPLSRGGKHHPKNLQILTQSKNRKKWAKIL